MDATRNGGIFGSGLSLRVLALGALFCASLAGGERALAQQTASGTQAAAGNGAAETTAPAKEKKRLTPDDAVSLAIKNNLSLESGRVTLDTKKRKSDLVWNQFLPDLAVNGTLSRANEEPKATIMGPITIPAAAQWSVAGNFSATLTLSAALGAGIQTIRRDYQTGVLTYEKAKVQTEREVRKQYNSILLLQENIVLQRMAFENAERQVQIARANYNAGLAPELTLLQAQVGLENRRPVIDDAENNLKALMAKMAMDLGLPYDTELELVPVESDLGFIPLDVAELISKASRNKPDILELQATILYLQSAKTAQSMQLWTPYLRFGWTVNPAFNKDPWKDTWGEKDNWTERGAFSITLGMNLNGILPFTKEGQGLKDLDNNMRIASIGLAQTIRGTEVEIYTKINSLAKTQISVEAQQAALNLAERAYRLTEEAYRAGLQDYQSVQNSEQELSQARLLLLTQHFNYLSDLIDLEYAIGVPFGTLSRSAE
jgi:outer membrane protein TolC